MLRRGPGLAVRPLALLLALAAGVLACASGQSIRETEFHEVQKHYTQLIRWSQFDRARNFVDAEAIGDFQSQAIAFGDVRFTDYAIREIDMQGDEATVRVTYYAYLRTSPVATAYEEQQEWRRAEGRAWRVRSSFAQREIQPGEGMF